MLTSGRKRRIVESVEQSEWTVLKYFLSGNFSFFCFEPFPPSFSSFLDSTLSPFTQCDNKLIFLLTFWRRWQLFFALFSFSSFSKIEFWKWSTGEVVLTEGKKSTDKKKRKRAFSLLNRSDTFSNHTMQDRLFKFTSH